MEKYILENPDSFNLVHIFECGQCFRWNKNESGIYVGIVGQNVLKIKENDYKIVIESYGQDDLEELFSNYFDMNRNYEEIKNKLRSIDGYMEESIKYGEGIRILNQDLWETIISFIISANNNIPRIKGIIEKMCKEYGTRIVWNNEEFYTFPSVEQLSKASVNDLRKLGLGFRDIRIYETTKLIKDGIKESHILAIDKEEMDITNKEEVMRVVKEYKPDVIFHCAAWTAVDKAEDMKELVEQVNVIGTKNIVDASIEIGAKVLYMSTDYVFDGKKEGEYEEDDRTNPQSIYGETKFRGEEEVRRNPKHFITRISWVFGINGNNFIKTMLKLAKNHKELNVVNDQIGSPTYTVDLAKLLVEMSYTEKYGTYNATNEEYCSWAEFAEYIFEINNKNVKVNKVTTEEYLEITKTKQAYRPKNSKLSKNKLEKMGFEKLPSWKNATQRYCKELNDRGV